jgi:hypothetical protein
MQINSQRTVVQPCSFHEIGPVSFAESVIISFAMLQKHHDFVVTHFVQWAQGKPLVGKPLGLQKWGKRRVQQFEPKHAVVKRRVSEAILQVSAAMVAVRERLLSGAWCKGQAGTAFFAPAPCSS